MQETIWIILVAVFISWKVEKIKPKPYEVKNGDILIVKVAGYGFCPKHCEVDHLHTGHKKNYNCKDKTCNHIIYEDRLN